MGVVVSARATTVAPLLMQLSHDSRLRLVGINYKDQSDNVRRFLGRYGNCPFFMNATTC